MAGAARADDLLVLNGDTETLSGDQSFGLVYIDGDLQLTGDTTISAASIYIGPDASIDSCFVVGSGDTCPAGRSLTLNSSGPLTVATGIDLSGGTNTLDPGGNLTLRGGPVAITNSIDTLPARVGRPRVRLRSRRPARSKSTASTRPALPSI